MNTGSGGYSTPSTSSSSNGAMMANTPAMAQNYEQSTTVISLDDMIKEYLVYRGFMSTVKSFETEKKQDKVKQFQSERIVEQIFQYLQGYEYIKFAEFWKYLESKFFAKWAQQTQKYYFASQPLSLVRNQAPKQHRKGTHYYTSSSPLPNSSLISPQPTTNSQTLSPQNIPFSQQQQFLRNVDMASPSRRKTVSEPSTAMNESDLFVQEQLHQQQQQAYSNNVYVIIKKLETSLKKYYLVHCLQTNKQDKCKEFLEQFGEELLRENVEWKDWFLIPFVKTPEQLPELSVYFQKQWTEMLSHSLQNFISAVLVSIEKPQLVLLETTSREKSRKRVEVLQKENDLLRKKLQEAESLIQQLKSQQEMSPMIKPVESNMDDSMLQAMQISKITNEMNIVISSSETEESSTLLPMEDSTTDSSEDALKFKHLMVSKVFSGHKDEITACQFSSHGSYIASASKDKTIRIWSTEQNASAEPLYVMEMGSEVTCLEWNKKEEPVLLCGTTNRKIRILKWNRTPPLTSVQQSKKQFPPQASISFSDFQLPEHILPRVTCIAASPQNSNQAILATTIASLRSNSSSGNLQTIPQQQSQQPQICHLLLFNLKQLRVECKYIFENPSPILHIMFNHNGKMFVCGSADGMVRIFDVNSPNALMTWKAHEGRVTSVNFSADETSIITCGTDYKVMQWGIQFEGKMISCLHLNATTNHTEPKIALSGENSACSFVLNDPGILFTQKERQFVPLYSLLQQNKEITNTSPLQTWQTLVAKFSSVDVHEHAIVGSAGNELYLYHF